MRYNSGKTIIYGFKFYVEASSPFMRNLIFIMRKHSKMEHFLIIN